MTIKRRDFLTFLGIGVGTVAIGSSGQSPLTQKTIASSIPNPLAQGMSKTDIFAIKLPLPLDIDNLTPEQQKLVYRTYEVVDDIVLPSGFTYDVIAAWGDKVGDSRFGYNNDYLSFIETAPNEGLLTINFEYISSNTWLDTYEKVIGKPLRFIDIKTDVPEYQESIQVFELPENDPLKVQLQQVCEQALIDLGIGVISLRRNEKGQWERTYSKTDRRITGISGLKDGRYLKSTGPAVAVFQKTNKLGYDDKLGDKIIGTFQNCAGGTTPWGTVFSAEENFQDQVPEPVMADGSSFAPSTTPLTVDVTNRNDRTYVDVNGWSHVFGLAGNKYGWMVEVDPANPSDYGTKHTWLGRYRHEAVAFLAVADKPLAVYSGCDRRGGHLYKFVSKGKVKTLQDKGNSRLMEDGMLYGAKFNPDGTGRWIALNPDTPIDPVLPSQVEGRNGEGMISLPNPNRTEGGIISVTRDDFIRDYKQQFKTLNDLYQGNPTEKQGAILIDAHFAANAVGVTCTARPEDTDMSEDGTLYITFTSGTPGSDGGPDKQIFKGPNGETPYEFGWIMRLVEDNREPAAMTFRWALFATGGEPAKGGLGFSNPDNLVHDNQGNIWMVTDMSTSSQNRAIPSRVVEGQPLSQTNLLGLFGNNSTWFIPTRGENAGNAYPFAIGPMDTEMTGPWFTSDNKTLFISVQHPGEVGSIRQNMESETRTFVMQTTNGEEFTQQRKVPIGSNWPSQKSNDPPRPAVVAIRRVNNQVIS
ncbi:protein of unknown function DUF839 [Gloeothece citriformis PCC 7424]|uniref:Phosphatase n=1 Tax=Gloeothece citriformis (strain PCC 7424) TaxID=65393 RepID=B7KEH7_GLOC7|nr:alkaline phosphatase PhoX [Gloeothece citriformis]ACK73295.1 protein of unknown function DUF839 [Gloeothece citriformis PCC 7424]